MKKDDGIQWVERDQILHSNGISETSDPTILEFIIFNLVIKNDNRVLIGFPQLISIGSWYTLADLSKFIDN